MKKFFKYAKKKTTNVDEGSVASFNSRTSVSLVSSSEFGSIPSLVGTSSVYYVDLKSKDKHFSKLHRAVWLGDLEKVKKQVKKDDVNCADSMKRTPLHLACARGNKEIVWFLLSCKADANLRDQEGFTPLLRAVQFHHLSLVQFLLDQNIDPNDTNHVEESALHLAAKENAIDMAMILLQKGANVDCANKDGSTPLHIATYNNLFDLAELFLRHGASVNAGDNDERTCLMLAARQGLASLVGLYLEFGANIMLKDKSGLTALDYATISEHNECLRMLGKEEKVQPVVEEVDKESIKDWDRHNDDFVSDNNNDGDDGDKVRSISPNLDSWNDDSEGDVRFPSKGLLAELNLSKFLSSLDDSDKEVSEIAAQIERSESVNSQMIGPPKPPRTSIGSTDVHPKSPRSTDFDVKDELKENEKELEEVFEHVNNSNIEIRKAENDVNDAGENDTSDISTPSLSDISDKKEKPRDNLTVETKENVKTKSPKPPVPPPRNSKIKSSSTSDWDTQSNSGISLEPSKVSDVPESPKKNNEVTLEENSAKCNGPITLVKNLQNGGDVPNEGKQRLYVKHTSSHRRTPSGGSVVLKDVHPAVDDDVISPYKALTDSESDWSDKEEIGGVKEVEKSPVKNEEGISKGVSVVSLQAAIDLEDEDSDWDSVKSEKMEDDDVGKKMDVVEQDGSQEMKGEEVKEDVASPVEVKEDVASPVEVKEDLSSPVEVKAEGVVVLEEKKDGDVGDEEIKNYDDIDEKLELQDEKLNVKRCNSEGTLGREDTLQGVDEIWENNAIVNLEDHENPSSTSTSSHSQIKDDILRPKCTKGNVAQKTTLFEIHDSKPDFDFEFRQLKPTPTRKLGKNLSMDTDVLESMETILQTQLAEQQTRLSKTSPPKISYKSILAQRRHSVENGGLSNFTTRKLGDGVQSSESNLSEPIGEQGRHDAGDSGLFSAKPVMAGSSSDDDLIDTKLGNSKNSMKRGVNGDKVKKFQLSGVKKSPVGIKKAVNKPSTRKLSLDKFPTLRRLTKKFSLTTDMKNTKEFSEDKENYPLKKTERQSSLESVEEDRDDFVQEVLDRLDIRRKSSPSLRDIVMPERKISVMASLDKVSESLSTSSSTSWDEDVFGDGLSMDNEKHKKKCQEKEEKDDDESPVVSIVKLKEPQALCQLKEFISELRLSLEREKGERQILSERVKCIACERDELRKKLEALEKEHGCIKQKAVELEAKLKTNEWELTQSENKWQESDNKLKQMITFLNKKEETLLCESSLRQQSELNNQSLVDQLKIVKETLGVLHDECKQLQTQFLCQQTATVDSRPSSPSNWVANASRDKEFATLRRQLDEANILCQKVLSENQSLQLQLNLHKQEVIQCRYKLDQREEWMKCEKARLEKELQTALDEHKVGQEALNQTTLGYMLQVNNLDKENNDLKLRLKLQSEKIEALQRDLNCQRQELTTSKGETCLMKQKIHESEMNILNEKEEQEERISEIKDHMRSVIDRNKELKENLHAASVKIAQLERNSKQEPKSISFENQLCVLQEEMAYIKSQLPHSNQTSPPTASRSFHPVATTSTQFSPGSRRILSPPLRTRTPRPTSRQQPAIKHLSWHSENSDSSPTHLASTTLVKMAASAMNEGSDRENFLKKEIDVVDVQKETNDSVSNYEDIENEMQQIQNQLEETQNKLQLDFDQSQQKIKVMQSELDVGEQIIEKLKQENLNLKNDLEHSKRDKTFENQLQDNKNQHEIEDLRSVIVQLENEARVLRIEAEEAKMHSHKLTDDILQLRLESQRSDELLLEETNKRQEITKQLEYSEELRKDLSSRVRALEEDRISLLHRLEKEVGDHRHLWEVEARGRAELALRLLDIEKKQHRPSSGLSISIGDAGDSTHKSTLYQKLIQQKEDGDLQLIAEREKCKTLEMEIDELRKENERLSANQVTNQMTKQTINLEKQVKELQDLLKIEEENHEATKNHLKKAKQKLLTIPDLKTQVAQLEQVRMELRSELNEVQEQVRINYIHHMEVDKIRGQFEAKFDYKLQCAIDEMRMKFIQQHKVYDEVEQVRISNDLQFRSDLQRSKQELMEEVTQLKTELQKSRFRADFLQDQCDRLQELYGVQVELRAKMSKEVQGQREAFINSAQTPFTLRNNLTNHWIETNQNKTLTWQKSTTTLKTLNTEDIPTPDSQNTMFYKVKAALDKSVKQYFVQ